ncbi:hypothetical protein Bca52824_089222 [Brassica carinata]|uniref:Phenylalanine--tRNA ligase n=1 Tax=Brassica carinata TaxID=52824 RepID=A0A8X7PHD1_BRACI|nr:hypothetical protein Bca52824_089222 [Brassica carinata]
MSTCYKYRVDISITNLRYNNNTASSTTERSETNPACPDDQSPKSNSFLDSSDPPTPDSDNRSNETPQKNEIKNLSDAFSRLNLIAKEFVPPSLARIQSGVLRNRLGFTNSFTEAQPVVTDGNGQFARRRMSFGQARRRSNKRTSLAQKEDVVKRTIIEENLADIYLSLRIAYLDEREETADAKSPKVFYSVLLKGGGKFDEEIYCIKLPGPPAEIGEGKPENQNHAIILTHDNYFEEDLNLRNVFEEFEKEHNGIEDETQKAEPEKKGGHGQKEKLLLRPTSGLKNNVAWTFGLGLERLAMVLVDIPDIRLFWSDDEWFTSQFAKGELGVKLKPFSKERL